jgi:hypothetical protein
MFSKIKEDAEKAKWMYEGELRQKHGDKEFEKFQRMGKWETKEDKDGDTMYRRVHETSTTTKRHEDGFKTIGTSSKLSDEQYEQMVEAMKRQMKTGKLALEDTAQTTGMKAMKAMKAMKVAKGSTEEEEENVDATDEQKCIDKATETHKGLKYVHDKVILCTTKLKGNKLFQSQHAAAVDMVPKLEKALKQMKDIMECEAKKIKTTKAKASIGSACQIWIMASKIVKAAKSGL